MTTEVKVPASGESVSSANVARWHKQNGETVRRGELLVTLDTDKVSNELEAAADGTLEIIVAEGEEVPIGAVIAKLHALTADSSGAAESARAAPEPPPPAPVGPPSAPVGPPPAPVGPPASPVTPPMPVAAGATVAGPGAAAQAPGAARSDGRTTRHKMSMLRRKIAVQLVAAQQTAAILTTFNEVDMTAVMELRQGVQEEFQRRHGVKLGLMSFFIKAVVQALKDWPVLNARIDGDDVVENHFYDIGVAIGTEKGLVVPVIRDADQKSFAAIEQDVAGYARRTREGKITLADLQGGVFTVSNGGTYGSLLSTPILNPPQSGILGMHTIQQRPVAIAGRVVIRPMMYLAVSYDHRLVDGREAVGFLLSIKQSLEAPARLLLEL